VNSAFVARTTLKARIGIALALTAFYLLCRWIFPWLGPWWLLLGNECALFLLLIAWAWAGSGFFVQRKNKPLTLVLFVLLQGALMLILLIFWRGGDILPAAGRQAGLFSRLLASLSLMLFVAILALIYSALQKLFYLKKSRQPGWYFKVMAICFCLTFFAPATVPVAVPFLMSLSICLLVLNSFRVKWIAFMVKRQKKQLIVLAGLALGILMADAILLFNNPALPQLISALSAGIFQIGKIVLLYGTCYSGVILFATLFHLPTADAYDRKAKEFASLVDLSQSITGMMEFKELAEKVTSVTAGVCHGDFSWLLIKESDEFNVPAAFNISTREALELSLVLLSEIKPDHLGVKVFRDKKLKIHIQNDILTFSFNSLAIAPLRVKNRTTGYLFMAIKKNLLFEEEDIQTVEVFANSAAIALENARLLETRLEKERLHKELEVARVIQYRLLPQEIPRFAYADIATYFSPAFEVGGDYYDFFHLDEQNLGFVIADVSGKGLAAAFIMAELKGIFESLSSVVPGPAQLLAKANTVLSKSLEKDRFVSASYGLIEPAKKILRVARAGHMPFFLFSGGEIKQYVPPGLVLGLAGEPLFSEKIKELSLPLAAGDVIVFITDGISEAKNLFDNEFGYERLQSAIQAKADGSAAELSDFIVREVKAFANQPVQHDDITMLVIKIR
jgi:phosphoserine phosphatase RsbU/P